MFKIILALAVVAAILAADEYLWRRKVLRGELKRKLVHIIVMCFVASWPWFLSWKTIQFIGIAMVLVLLINRQVKVLHYLGDIRQKTYGDIFLALAVTTAALMTDVKVFFALAILCVALADGLAAIVGTKFGGYWKYKVFGCTKSVIGTMVFWIVSLCVLGGGIMLANNEISLDQYTFILVFLPPILTFVENLAVFGMDNLAIPVVAIIALQLSQR